MNNEIIEKKLILEQDPLAVFGTNDQNLKYLSTQLKSQIVGRGREVLLSGDVGAIEYAENVLREIQRLVKRNGNVTKDDIQAIISLTAPQEAVLMDDDNEPVILHTNRFSIKPKTPGQKKYYECVQKNDIVFGIGPAGTGKTFLAVAMAVAHLRDQIVDRITLCRPAVEAGESLGFLPGDLRDKVDPYLRPLYDALYDMVPLEKLKKQLENHIVEIVPLAYMRGRTLNNSFVILDEAQNTTSAQMKMFLTRLGPNSKAIITGDTSQIDIPDKSKSGLILVQRILKDIDGIGFNYFSEYDVVRHRLIRKIIKAYDKYEETTK